LAADAPWANKRIFWIGMAAFIGVDFAVDFFLVALHRIIHPVPGESPYRTWLLLMDPRQHWPMLQEGVAPGEGAVEHRTSR
jgi:hypothetical protein